MSCIPSPIRCSNARTEGPSYFRAKFKEKSKVYRNRPGALQSHISTHPEYNFGLLARPSFGNGKSGRIREGGRGESMFDTRQFLDERH